jgi:hypothetical protein
LQQYEWLLKTTISRRKLTGSAGTLQQRLAEHITRTSTKTLGQLIGEFTRDHLKPMETETEEAASPAIESLSELITLELSISVPPDKHAAICKQLGDLVDLRNHLVHHFVEAFDLVSEPGCRKADAFLSECYEKIDGHALTLQGWVASGEKARAIMQSVISTPGFFDP